jgi:beta-lactamase class A
MSKILFLTLTIFLCLSSAVFADNNELKEQIEQVIKNKKAEIGVSIYNFENKENLLINNDKHFPLQSVFKFHIALAILNEVDKGKFSLEQKILVKKSDLLPNTWSPLREEYKKGDFLIPLEKIIRYSVAKSDNNACDILLRLLGSPQVVHNYIHSLNIKDFAIVVNEEEMHKTWDIQFKNWTTPEASTQLLKAFYERKILSSKSYAYLWKVMTETETGKDRIKGQLPKGTIVAHKTGTSDTNEQGITSAINDIGIVQLPKGKPFAISVFVSNSKENKETNEKIISDISKLTWDYYIKKN